MKKRHIGMIFDDRTAMRAAFYSHAFGLVDPKHNDTPQAEISSGWMKITYPNGIEYEYILIRDSKDMNKIAGLQFDAVFSDVRDPDARAFILSRFRPQL